jgi:hypothetical protein
LSSTTCTATTAIASKNSRDSRDTDLTTPQSGTTRNAPRMNGWMRQKYV